MVGFKEVAAEAESEGVQEMREVDQLLRALDGAQHVVIGRDRRYQGIQPLRYAADDVTGDLKMFSVNLCKLAVDAVAERMRVTRVSARVRGQHDVSDRANELYLKSNLDQLLQPAIIDALALGAAYLMVWTDRHGRVTITSESAKQVAVSRDPITGEVDGAVKRWLVRSPEGILEAEHVVHYTPSAITHYVRDERGNLDQRGDQVHNAVGVVPVIPMVNITRAGQSNGYSVIDDMGHLVDALSKILSDMLVASEDVARPRRWATGVDLEEDDGDDGFSADDVAGVQDVDMSPAVSPFESGNRMFTVESPDAKFGQLPGADLKGYETAVNLILQQIMAVSALPAHMMGVTTANPSSADAIRAAEASLTARAESRIKVLGLAVEHAVALALAIDLGVPVHEVQVQVKWGSAASKSLAQESDAVAKLHALMIVNTSEAREMMGIESL